MASVFTFNENGCGMRREQVHALAPTTAEPPTRWAPFTITVTETTTLEPEQCEHPDIVQGSRSVAATFNWNAASGTYEPDTSALEDLLAETEARF